MGSPSKQPAARLGDIDTGHPPAPPTPIITASGNVFINGRPAARKGDMLVPHHPGVRIITEGSGSVKINGKLAARITDAINCGGKIIVGSGNVLIGDIPPSGSPLAPGEWQDFIDSSIGAGPQSLYQSQQMRADMAVKYRGKAAGSDSWKAYYSDINPKDRPSPASVQNTTERTGLELANSAKPAPMPALPGPQQQQVIDNAGQQMQKAIANLAEGEMVTPEMLTLANTMMQAGVQSNKNSQSTGSSVPNKVTVTPSKVDWAASKALGLEIGDPRDYAVGNEIFKSLKQSGLEPDRALRMARDVLESGVDLPTIATVQKGDQLFKLVPTGSSPSSTTPYFITSDVLERLPNDPQAIGNILGLPQIPDSFELFSITAKQNVDVYQSQIAKFSVNNGTFVRDGGDRQTIVTQRDMFTEAQSLKRFVKG